MKRLTYFPPMQRILEIQAWTAICASLGGGNEDVGFEDWGIPALSGMEDTL